MLTLTRWNPLQEMETMRKEFDDMFEPFFRFRPAVETPQPAFIPPVDIEETANELILRAELPGFTPEDVEITFENNVLTLRGERKFDSEKKDRNFHRIERSYGNFTRSFTLPMSVNAESATAHFENGILELHLPKREEAKPRRIEIKGAQKAIEATTK